MNRAFWKAKKVLVTGYSGFKGSWLALWLQSLGADLMGYALCPPTEPNLFEIADVSRGMTGITGDIRDLENLKTVIARHRPEIVIHMAAQALVQYSYHNPVETYSTNIMGTVNVLEAVRHSESVRVVVCITSDKCYENNEWFWGYRENERMGGRDPYSSSKGCAELIISAYRNSYFPAENHQRHSVALASTRAGNVIGGGDWAKYRLIPDIMKSLMEKRPVIIRNPKSIRPWQHVLEPLSGYLLLAEQLWERGPELAQAWNFGPNDEEVRNVAWIADYLTKQWEDGGRWEQDSASHPHEDTYLKLDCSKAKSLLGWSPRLHLSTALDWIVAWYRGWQQNEDMHRLSLAQIDRYERIKGAQQ
ncbi:MAG: CDP-glucose 4,6-dehydratase [Candidatus Binatia bacterium]